MSSEAAQRGSFLRLRCGRCCWPLQAAACFYERPASKLSFCIRVEAQAGVLG